MTESNRRRPFRGGQFVSSESMERQVSTRGIVNPPGVPVVNVPGAPQGIPSALPTFVTPEGAKTLDEIIAKAIQDALDMYSIYTQSKPFDMYHTDMVVVGAAAAVRLDALDQAQKGRRALIIQNCDLVADLWVGKANTVAVNNGIWVPPNGATYLVSIHEREPHFGISSAGNINVSVTYYA